jgi:hypothetical protein
VDPEGFCFTFTIGVFITIASSTLESNVVISWADGAGVQHLIPVALCKGLCCPAADGLHCSWLGVQVPLRVHDACFTSGEGCGMSAAISGSMPDLSAWCNSVSVAILGLHHT